MKTTVTIIVKVETENTGQTFEKAQAFDLSPDDSARRFPAVVTVAEQVLGDVHREFCPTPEEKAAREGSVTEANEETTPNV